jgi:hypothetical protein
VSVKAVKTIVEAVKCLWRPGDNLSSAVKMLVEALRLLIGHKKACKGLRVLAQAVIMLVEAMRGCEIACRGGESAN